MDLSLIQRVLRRGQNIELSDIIHTDRRDDIDGLAKAPDPVTFLAFIKPMGMSLTDFAPSEVERPARSGALS